MGTSAKDGGFTLIELMIVVLIIGILVSIAVPVFVNAASGAYARSCQANQRTILGSIAMSQSFGEDTSGVGAADAALDASSGWGNVFIPHYIKSAPRCTATGGGLYNLSPAGEIVSDKGAGQMGFINQGVADDHEVPH